MNGTCSTGKDMLGLVILILASAGAVTLNGSSNYGVPDRAFDLICDVPEEANSVKFFRRSDTNTAVARIQVGVDRRCFNTFTDPASLCTQGYCSCMTVRPQYGISFIWTIHPVMEDHLSDWFCESHNSSLPSPDDVVLTSENYTLQVAVLVAGVELQNPPSGGQHIVVTENQPISLVCVTSPCRPSASILWSVGGVNYTSSSVLTVGAKLNGTYTTTSTLTFTPDRDMAEYVIKCSAKNLDTVVQATVQPPLNVRYGPGNITFTPPEDVVEIVENQTTPNMTCSADCRPPCIYSWSKGSNIYPNPLSLSTAVRGNAGNYTCNADNNVVGPKTKTWNLIVRYPPRITSLAYTPADTDVHEGGEISLVCTTEAYPAPTIRWYYKANNTELLIATDTLASTYTLTNAGCLDTGVYTCSVINSETNTPVTMDIPVNVLCKPRRDIRVTQSPILEIGMSESLVIQASFITNPESSFTWKLHKTKMTQDVVDGDDGFVIDNYYGLKNLSAVSVLTRENMEEKWFGVYIVTATNTYGSETILYTIDEKVPPVPTTDDQNTGAIVGGVVGSIAVAGILITIAILFIRRRQSGRSKSDGGTEMDHANDPKPPYDQLDSSQIVPAQVYDQFGNIANTTNSHDTHGDDSAAIRTYEDLQTRPNPDLYDDLQLPQQDGGRSPDAAYGNVNEAFRDDRGSKLYQNVGIIKRSDRKSEPKYANTGARARVK